MTREEAIKRLEWLRMVGNHVDSVTLGKEDMPYFDMAIAALMEQEELQERLDAALGTARMWCRKYHEKITEPRWISVEERLPEPKTNAQHIRSMNDEELSVLLSKPWCENHRLKEECLRFDTDCQACVMDWIKQPYGGDT